MSCLSQSGRLSGLSPDPLQKQPASDRKCGPELLRSVLMLLIVVMHICTQGGILDTVSPFTSQYHSIWGVMLLAYPCVDAFILISGYFGVSARFHYRKIAHLWLQMAFYTVLITAAFCIFKPGSVSFMEWLKALTPATSGQYWYVCCYFGLLVFMPFLNRLLNALDRKELYLLLFSIVIAVSLLPTLRHTDPFKLDSGYSLAWMVCVYLIGGCIRKLELFEKCKTWHLVLFLTGGLVLTYGSKVVIEQIVFRLSGEVRGGGYLFTYTSPTVILIAAAALGLFLRLDIQNAVVARMIRAAGKSTLGVFLIHEHPLIKHQFLSDRFIGLASEKAPVMVLSVLGHAICIFTVCIIIDYLRGKLFALLPIDRLIDRICQKFHKIFHSLLKTK